MDTTAIAKEIINYQKSLIESAFEAASLFQDQTERIASAWIEKNNDITAESRKSIQQWTKLLNKGSQNYKKIMDDQLNKFENLFAKPASSRPLKTTKMEVKPDEEEGKKQTAAKK